MKQMEELIQINGMLEFDKLKVSYWLMLYMNDNNCSYSGIKFFFLNKKSITNYIISLTKWVKSGINMNFKIHDQSHDQCHMFTF